VVNKITPVNPALASRFQSLLFAGRVTEFRRSISGRTRGFLEIYMSFISSALVYCAAAITLVAVQV